MAPNFAAALGTKVLVGARNLSQITNESGLDASVDLAETTCYETSTGGETRDKTYIPGHRDATASFSGLYDGSTDSLDDFLREQLASSSPPPFSWGPSGDAIGKRAVLIDGDVSALAGQAAGADAVKWTLAVQASERRGGYWLSPLQTLSSTGALTAVSDPRASTTAGGSTRGGVAHVHITSLSTGSTGQLLIQHSTDGSSWSDLLTVGLANTSTDPNLSSLFARSTVAGTVKERLRANLHQLSGSDSATLAVSFARHS